ncbi:hypothetical protein ACUR5C_04510 [Aliikangiella sp. IMCC44653]
MNITHYNQPALPPARRALLLTAALLISVLFTPVTWSQNIKVNSNAIVVVTHKNNSLDKLAYEEVVDLFMGKTHSSPSGELIKPLEISENQALKRDFYANLTGLSLARVNAYWSRIQFTGRMRPPLAVDSAQQALAYLEKNKDAVVYIYQQDVTEQLKVVYKINE